MSTTTALPPGQEWRLSAAGYGDKLGGGLWRPAPHHALISQKLVETVAGVNRRRLAIAMPPRHGKTETIVLHGGTWYLDVYPERHIGIVTYGAELSEEWGGKLRDHVRANPEHLRVRVRRDSHAKAQWTTTRGGGCYSIGIGGPFVGRGVGALFFDDPHKSWEEAQSATYRDKVFDYWTGTARHRLDPGGAVAVIHQRWHEDDMIGKLTANDDRWEYIRLPAICTADTLDPKTGVDIIGRHEGDPLWPWRYTLDELLDIRSELGEYVFEAVYQQNPTAPAGLILKREWWRYYTQMPDPLGWEAIVQSWDMTFKDTKGTDFVVGQVWGLVGARRFLLDQVRARLSFVDTCDVMRIIAKKWPTALAKYVEDTANGPAVISQLKAEIPGLIPVTPKGSKESRVHAVSPAVRAGNIWLPQDALPSHFLKGRELDSYNPKDFVNETAMFPKGGNDDQVDAFTQMCLETGLGGGTTVQGSYDPRSTQHRRR